jgi:hypothetical protein
MKCSVGTFYRTVLTILTISIGHHLPQKSQGSRPARFFSHLWASRRLDSECEHDETITFRETARTDMQSTLMTSVI